MDTPRPRAGLGVLGAGAAACAACCAGPVLGFLAATGIASVLGALVFGVVGLAVVLAVAAVFWQRRRRRAGHCSPADGPVKVDSSQLMTKSSVGEA
jgi:membrane protein implicated in regulation of membrane protease activity